MKTTNLTTDQENRKSVLFINYSNTKRMQWDKYRRYGLYNS